MTESSLSWLQNAGVVELSRAELHSVMTAGAKEWTTSHSRLVTWHWPLALPLYQPPWVSVCSSATKWITWRIIPALSPPLLALMSRRYPQWSQYNQCVGGWENTSWTFQIVKNLSENSCNINRYLNGMECRYRYVHGYVWYEYLFRPPHRPHPQLH